MSDKNISGLHAIERGTGCEIDHRDMAFFTSHVPDIPPRNRIVAVCGISDIRDSASPLADGWFFSDFWLFHHLLHPVCTRSTNQVWLMCEEPSYLVEKYGQYVHGEPQGDRRVVFDNSFLQWVEAAGNVWVVQREILKERFVSTVREQALLAQDNLETLILLIFGHGDANSYGIYLGGNRLPDRNAVLQIRELKRALPSNVNTTLMMTSCYSGGWLVKPKLDSSHLNVTGFAAAGPFTESRSWPVTRSAGRACGSMFATAIANHMMKVEGDAKNETEDHRSHPTYVGLIDSIYQAAVSMDGLVDRQGIHFSAQNDEWEAHWSERTGVPLTRFQDRWHMLRKVPPGAKRETCPGIASSCRVGALKQELTLRAHEYFEAKPGQSCLASNVALHGNLYAHLDGVLVSGDKEEKLRWLLDFVVYRLSLMHQADEIVNAMGLSFPSCLGYSVDIYEPTAEISKTQQQAFRYLSKARLIDTSPDDVPEYRKPIHFLSIVLAETCSEDQIVGMVDRALKFKERKVKQHLLSAQGDEILTDTGVVEKKGEFKAQMKKLRKRVFAKALSLSRDQIDRQKSTKDTSSSNNTLVSPDDSDTQV